MINKYDASSNEEIVLELDEMDITESFLIKMKKFENNHLKIYQNN